MKSVRSTYIAFIRRPRLAVAGLLAIAWLLAACGGSATGATPDSISKEQATPTSTLERPTEIRPTEEGATGAVGATPIVVPTPDQGGPSREELAALLASPTPRAPSSGA